jgi:hypothetical protein
MCLFAGLRAKDAMLFGFQSTGKITGKRVAELMRVMLERGR